MLLARLGPSECPRLRVLALLKPPSDEVIAAAGLALVRAAAVSVSWLSAFGWPLYVYRREAGMAGRVVVDEGFAAARENSDWFSMV